MKRFLTLLTIVATLGMFGQCPVKSQTTIPENEKNALIDFYNQCDGKNWTNSHKWDLSQDPSKWNGVVIKDGHVIELDLWFSGVKGQLPQSLSTLKELTKLELSCNSISGNLPEGIFVLPKLNYLNLSMQNIGGQKTLTSSLPKNINLPSCECFYLNDNALSGRLPENVTLPKVQWILLNNNNLKGQIPATWSNFPNLILYALYDNEFEGDINFDFSKMPLLREFLLGGSKKGNKGLTGTLDKSIYKLNLIQLEIQNTGIGGHLEEEIGNWQHMSRLLLYGSKFSGKLPQSLGDMLDLEILNIAGGNQFEGPLPNLSKLRKLRRLIISGNPIGGKIPSFLSQMKSLIELRMGSCNLEGNLPAELAPDNGDNQDQTQGLDNCFELDFSDNNLEGTIPESWGNFQNLSTLNLRGNKLSGNPIATVMKIPSIGILLLNDNQFNGELSTLLEEDLPSLGNCNISNNHFYGPLVTQRYTYNGADEPFNKFYPAKLVITGNDFNFKSFENVGLNNMEDNNYEVVYDSMNPYGQELQVEIKEGDKQLELNAITDEPIDINDGDKIIPNQYQWYLDEKPIKGATNKTYSIQCDNNPATGIYHCKVKNKIAPNLTLQSKPIIVTSKLSAVKINNDSKWICNGKTIKYSGASEIYLYNMNGDKIMHAIGEELEYDNLSANNYIAIAIINDTKTATKLYLK